jgi:hypothetical protein
MFHWMPQRITAHVKLCVLALMIRRRAELATDLTWSRLRALLEPLEAVRWRSGERAMVQTTRIGADARDPVGTRRHGSPHNILKMRRFCSRLPTDRKLGSIVAQAVVPRSVGTATLAAHDARGQVGPEQR